MGFRPPSKNSTRASVYKGNSIYFVLARWLKLWCVFCSKLQAFLIHPRHKLYVFVSYPHRNSKNHPPNSHSFFCGITGLTTRAKTKMRFSNCSRIRALGSCTWEIFCRYGWGECRIFKFYSFLQALRRTGLRKSDPRLREMMENLKKVQRRNTDGYAIDTHKLTLEAFKR